MATQQPPIDPMREQYFHKVLELVNQNEMAANKIFSILSSSPDSLELFTSQNRLVTRVEELVVTLRLNVGPIKQLSKINSGDSKNNNTSGKPVGLKTDAPTISTSSGIPTTPIVTNKNMLPGSSSNPRFSDLFKQVQDVAFTACEDANLAKAIATQLCSGKDILGMEGMCAAKKQLQNTVEKSYKDRMSDSFLNRITEISDASKAPGLLKVIMGLPVDQVRVLVKDDGKLKEKIAMISSYSAATEWKPPSSFSTGNNNELKENSTDQESIDDDVTIVR